MDLYLLDENLNPIAIIDDYVSLVWNERFRDTGEFELRLKTTKWKLSDFKPDRYLTKSDSYDTMIIESREISNDAEEGSFLDVKGRSVTSLLERRINASIICSIHENKSYTYSGDIASVAKKILQDEFIDPYLQDYIKFEELPEDEWDPNSEYPQVTFENRGKIMTVPAPERKMDVIALGDFSDIGITVEKEYTEVKDCLTLLKELCEKTKTNVGFTLRLNYELRKFEFKIVQGVDRTLGQYDNEPLYFSQDMSNIIYVDYYEDWSTFRNAVFSVGNSGKADYGEFGVYWNSGMPIPFDEQMQRTLGWEIEPGYQIVYSNENTISGIARREAVESSNDFEISRNPSDSSATKSENGEMTNSNPDYSNGTYINYGYSPNAPNKSWISEQCEPYISSLRTTGRNYLDDKDHQVTVESTGEIDTNVMYQYGIDYFLGDKVEVDTGYDLNYIAVIDEVVYSYDENGIVATPNFTSFSEYTDVDDDS